MTSIGKSISGAKTGTIGKLFSGVTDKIKSVAQGVGKALTHPVAKQIKDIATDLLTQYSQSILPLPGQGVAGRAAGFLKKVDLSKVAEVAQGIGKSIENLERNPAIKFLT